MTSTPATCSKPWAKRYTPLLSFEEVYIKWPKPVRTIGGNNKRPEGTGTKVDNVWWPIRNMHSRMISALYLPNLIFHGSVWEKNIGGYFRGTPAQWLHAIDYETSMMSSPKYQSLTYIRGLWIFNFYHFIDFLWIKSEYIDYFLIHIKDLYRFINP